MLYAGSCVLCALCAAVCGCELRVSVCTISGCVASGPVFVRTLEEAPSELRNPELVESRSTALDLVWSPPKFPNGKLLIVFV